MVDMEAGAGGAALVNRIVAAPQLVGSADAHACVADWLSEIAVSSASETLRALFDAHAAAYALVASLAEGAPYLWDLARAQPQRLIALLTSDPDGCLIDIFARTASAIEGATDDAVVMRHLRL